MADFGWGSREPLIDWLLAEPRRFDMFQAIRLLRRALADPRMANRLGGARDLALGARVSRGFVPADVDGIELPAGEDDTVTLRVAAISLAGHHGALPEPYTDFVLDQERVGNAAPAAFLDIFNHRLIELFHALRQTHRPGLWDDRPTHLPHLVALRAWLGLLGPGLAGRLSAADEVLLPFAGMLAGPPRSAAVIERTVAGWLGGDVPVRLKPLAPRWLPIDRRDRTAIGRRRGRNGILGHGAAIGRRARDHTSAVRLDVGPATAGHLRRIARDESQVRAFAELVQFVADETVVVDMHLSVVAEGVSTAAIGTAVLGRGSWLRARRSGRPTLEARIAVYSRGPSAAATP